MISRKAPFHDALQDARPRAGSKDFCAATSAITYAHPHNALSAFPPVNPAPYISA
jgi:hypothetical protein